MSTDPYVSSDAVTDMRREIRTLVQEIAALARSEVEPEEFFDEFLTRIVSAMAAIGGAVWMLEEGAGLALKSHVNLQQTKLADHDAEAQARHGRLIQKAFVEGSSFLALPHSETEGVGGARGGSGNGGTAGETAEGGPPAGNPTDCLLVLAPLRSDMETRGVVEVFQRADTGRDAQRGYLRFVVQMCELAADYFRSRDFRSLTDRETLWTQLEQFTQAAHASLDVRETAYTLVNEGRRLIECDRVSLAVARGRKFKIEAISGQDVFEKRSNTVRLLGRLAGMAADSRDPIWYGGETADLAPQIEDAIQEYVDESHSKVLGVLPLVRPTPGGRPERDPDEPEEPERIVGVLIVERIEDSRVPPQMLQRIEYVCGQGASALANAWEHEDVFLMPVWKALGKTRWLVSARTLPKTVLAAIAVVVLAAVMVFWPAELEMEATGTLEPVVRHNIFAGLDGRVEDVLVDHGQTVCCHALLGVKGTAAPGPIFGRFLAGPQDGISTTTLLSVPSGACSFVSGGVQRGDTLRALLPSGPGAPPEWTDLRIGQVVDAQTLQLEDGPVGPVVGPVQVEVWRITPLVRLRSTELEMDVTSVTGRQATIRQQRDTTRRLLLEQDDLSVEQRNRLSGQLSELEEELRSLDTKLQLYRRKQRELLIMAPSDGVVMTWDVDHRLADRPIRRGQFLMQIADPHGLWELELKMPEDQIGFVLDAQRERASLAPPDNELEVRYVLATDPGTPHTGRVVEIHRAAEVSGQEGSTVLMKVKLDDDSGGAAGVPIGPPDGQLSADRQAGAELRARVLCGERSLGYTLFHDLVAFVQTRILFRL